MLKHGPDSVFWRPQLCIYKQGCGVEAERLTSALPTQPSPNYTRQPGIQSYVASMCFAEAVHACDELNVFPRRDNWFAPVATGAFVELWL